MFDSYKMPKYKSHSITDKLAVIASIKYSESKAHDNGLQESTICGWLRGEEKLHDFVHMQ